MFSLAISSICDCWRRRSASIDAASSGSVLAKASEKKPAVGSAIDGRAEEIARTTPLGTTAAKSGAELHASYHMSGADVSRLPDIASHAIHARPHPATRPGRDKSLNETRRRLIRN